MWASSDENNSTGTQPPPSGGNTYNQNTQNDWRNNYNAPGPSTNWSNSNNLNTSGDNVTCNCGQPAKK